MATLTKMITLKEASKISGYHPDYLSYLIRSGSLRGEKAGRNWLTSEKDVRKLILVKKNKSTPARKIFNLVAVSFLLVIGLAAVLSMTNLNLAEDDSKNNSAAADMSTEKYIIVETKLPR